MSDSDGCLEADLTPVVNKPSLVEMFEDCSRHRSVREGELRLRFDFTSMVNFVTSNSLLEPNRGLKVSWSSWMSGSVIFSSWWRSEHDSCSVERCFSCEMIKKKKTGTNINIWKFYLHLKKEKTG